MRQSIKDTYKELLAVRNDSRWPYAQPRVMPDAAVMAYTEKHGRKEGLLYNNRIHWMGSGDGHIVSTGLGSPEQYNVNRDWILANFKK